MLQPEHRWREAAHNGGARRLQRRFFTKERLDEWPRMYVAERNRLRETARQALRGFIDRIVIPPDDALLQVVGNLGSMLTAANGRNGSALVAVGNGGCGGGSVALATVAA